VYETLFHEMYLERDRGLVIADVVDWLTRRFGASRATSGRA
jgi:hypothetical protein